MLCTSICPIAVDVKIIDDEFLNMIPLLIPIKKAPD